MRWFGLFCMAAAAAFGQQRDVADSILFPDFVNPVQMDYQALTFQEASVPLQLDAQYADLHLAATQLNTNFELFDGDEVIQTIADLDAFTAAIDAFSQTLTAGTPTTAVQAAARDMLLDRLTAKRAEALAVRSVSTRIRDDFHLVQVGTSDYRLGANNELVTDVRDYLAALHELVAEADAVFGATATEDVLRAIIAEAEEGLQILGQLESAREHVEQSLSSGIELQNLTGLRNRRQAAARPMAGAAVSDPVAGVESSYGWFRDSAAALKGTDVSNNVYARFRVADDFDIGLSCIASEYKITHGIDFRRRGKDLALDATWAANDHLSLGVYADYAKVEIRGAPVLILGSPVDITDDYSRWTAGVLASWSGHLGAWDYGLTASTASGNKPTLGDLFNSTDTSVSGMVDIGRGWTDSVRTTAYATWFTLLNQNGPGDPSMGFIGLDTEYRFNDRWALTVGWEATVGYKDYRGQSVQMAVQYSW